MPWFRTVRFHETTYIACSLHSSYIGFSRKKTIVDEHEAFCSNPKRREFSLSQGKIFETRCGCDSFHLLRKKSNLSAPGCILLYENCLIRFTEVCHRPSFFLCKNPKSLETPIRNLFLLFQAKPSRLGQSVLFVQSSNAGPLFHSRLITSKLRLVIIFLYVFRSIRLEGSLNQVSDSGTQSGT